MVPRKKEKIAVLILTPIIILLPVLTRACSCMALGQGSPWYTRLTYSFAHVNPLHAIVNCWCMLSLAFSCNVSAKQFLAAIVIAASFPTPLLQHKTVMGLSGVCFAIFGMIMWKAKRKTIFLLWAVAMIAFGFLFSACAATLHAYCFLCGLALGFITTPISMLNGE